MGMLEPTLDALPSQVALLNEHGAIVYVNRTWIAFAEANGYLGPDFIGVDYLNLCHGAVGAEQADAIAFGNGLKSVLEGEEQHFDYVYACHAPDEPRWFKGLIQRAGRQVVVMHVDITEECRQQQVLSHATPSKDLVHDLLSPLNAISGFAELSLIMPRDMDDGRQLEDNLRTIHQASQRLTRMISDFFTDETDHAQPALDTPAQTDLGALMTETVKTFAAVAERAGVKLHLSVDIDDAVVQGGETVYWRILSNLISNAIRFNRIGGAAVCSLHRNPANGIEIEIADTGIGITRNALDTLSAPDDKGTATDKTNSGVGLSTVKTLCESLDARLDIESAKGEGTTVKVILPAWRTINTALAS